MKFAVSGHCNLADSVVATLAPKIEKRLAAEPYLVCLSNLAEGADQLVARLALELGGALEALVPCQGYEETFTTPAALSGYRQLLARARTVEYLDFDAPSEEAFFAAGREIVRRCERLIALWDGKPSRGRGGTADVIAFARGLPRPVEVFWPVGHS